MPLEKPTTGKKAALLIAHGSRRDAANQDLAGLADALAARAIYPLVEIAYLELARPPSSKGVPPACDRGPSRFFCCPISFLPVPMSPTTWSGLAAN